MKKATILGIGNQREYNYIIVKRQKNFFEWLKALLSVFNFRSVDEEEEVNSKGETIGMKKKDINEFSDRHESYWAVSKDTRADVFYGKDKIFIAIITPLKNKNKLMKKLNSISDFLKPKEEFDEEGWPKGSKGIDIHNN